MSNTLTDDAVRQAVRKTYGEIAKQERASCGCSPSTGGGGPAEDGLAVLSGRMGYSEDEIQAAPEGANLGLGCGNPQAIAALKAGETMLDLGSGAGFDCFLAARRVGETGRVIGVDMTPEMVSKARQNAQKAGYRNVEFRLGEIEALPVPDGTVDVILSNCVVNLSPDKPRVYGEAYRVLKPGGRLAISDIVATAEMPEKMRNDLALIAGCIAGAATIPDLECMLTETGFEHVRVRPIEASRKLIREWFPASEAADYIVSATVEAVRPRD